MTSSLVETERQETGVEKWTKLGGPAYLLIESGQSLGRGDWIEAEVCGLQAAIDLVGILKNPVDLLLRLGVGWLIDHVEPFPTWLDQLAGNPEAITAMSGTWSNISERIHDTAARYRSAAWSASAGWNGVATAAYSGSAVALSGVVEGLGTAIAGVSGAVAGAGSLVAGVRQIVRDALRDIVVSVIKNLPKLFSGAGIPAALAELGLTVRRWLVKVRHFVESLIRSVGKLSRLLLRLKDQLESTDTGLLEILSTLDDLPQRGPIFIAIRERLAADNPV